MAIDWEKTGALVGGIGGVVGIATGIGGLVLAIFNRRHLEKQAATRVRVEAILRDGELGTAKRFFVRVINDSVFAVRIQRVGLVLRHDDGSLQTVPLVDLDRPPAPRNQLISLDDMSGDLPHELRERSAITMRLSLAEAIALDMMPFVSAFAETAIGERFDSEKHGPLVGKTLVQMRAAAGQGMSD